METIVATIANPIATKQLLQELSKLELEGTLYIGYPVLAGIDEPVFVDGLLVSKRSGLVVFHFPKGSTRDPEAWEKLKSEQEDLYFALTRKLMEQRQLRRDKGLAIYPTVLCYLSVGAEPLDEELQTVDSEHLAQRLSSVEPIQEEYFKPLVAAIQRVSNLKPTRRRTSVKKKDSRGAILKIIEKEIANLDVWQNQAAIETPEGPQCIRGLAGSGKTVVLALKAAFLHAKKPDWNIVVTFHTRSLYQQFKELIRKFSVAQTGDEPDWTKLRIAHSWGSKSEPGVYSEIALSYGVQPKTFTESKLLYGSRGAFGGVCQELLDMLKSRDDSPIYDAILIDEFQDLPPSFIQLIYRKGICKPHRIVWAYDELQNLSDNPVLPAEELFGLDERGLPLETLKNEPGKPRQDIMLPICYRNTPWALTTAHAVGFGIYRSGGLVQLFENSSQEVWERLGYELVKGRVEPGHEVVLRRRTDSAPSYFNLLTPIDSVSTTVVNNSDEQSRWLVENIVRNLNEDELEPSDVLVILPDPFSVPKEAKPVRDMLKLAGIPSHLAGITSSRDELFVPDSVAITGIFRAKGNEAPMVYILNSQYCAEGPELIRRRNTLFTAITRSKAWVRICGYGTAMGDLRDEISKVATNDYHLIFRVPSAEELSRLKTIYREITREERRTLDSMEEFLDLLGKGQLSVEQIPKDMRERIKKYFA